MAKSLTEKAAFIKGMAEGLNLDESKLETKIIKALLDLIDDITLTVADLDDEMLLIGEQLDAVDEDLDDLESFVYEEYDDDDFYYDDDDDDCCCEHCHGDDEFFEVECPNCGEVINVDEGILEEGSIDCPNCGTNLEFDIEFDEEDGEGEDKE